MATDPLAPGHARANTPYRLPLFGIGTQAPRVPASLDSFAAAARNPLPPIQPAYPGHGARMAALLALEPRREIEDAICLLLAVLDARDGDPDTECSDGDVENESAPDTSDMAWGEWDSRGRHKITACGTEAPARCFDGWLLHEDSEKDDSPEDDDAREEDDHSAACDDGGEPGAWAEAERQPDLMRTYGEADDEPKHVPAAMVHLHAGNDQ